MRIHVWGLLLTMLTVAFATTALAQDIALAEHRSRVQIPQTGQGSYVLEVHVPAQTLQGDRFRVSFRRPVAGSASISAFGRVEAGQARRVAMERLTLEVEGFEVNAAGDKTEIWGFSHRVNSPRDARSTDGAPARDGGPRIRLAIPLPDLVLADLSAASTASEDHKGWINLLSVDQGGHVPGSNAAASGAVTVVTELAGTAPPPRLEFNVESGALQRELARTHEERSALAVEVRGWDLKSKRQTTWKLKRVFVSSYRAEGAGARVVIETGPPVGSIRAPTRSN